MILSDEMVKKAASALASTCSIHTSNTFDAAKDCARAALLAVLPDIEKAVREECAQMADRFYDGEYIATSIRALPPSTESRS